MWPARTGQSISSEARESQLPASAPGRTEACPVRVRKRASRRQHDGLCCLSGAPPSLGHHVRAICTLASAPVERSKPGDSVRVLEQPHDFRARSQPRARSRTSAWTAPEGAVPFGKWARPRRPKAARVSTMPIPVVRAHRTSQSPLGGRLDDRHAVHRALLRPLGRRRLPISVDQHHRVVPPRDSNGGQINGRGRLPNSALEIRQAKVEQKFSVRSLARKEKAPVSRAFEVAGAGFEPATSGLCDG